MSPQHSSARAAGTMKVCTQPPSRVQNRVARRFAARFFFCRRKESRGVTGVKTNLNRTLLLLPPPHAAAAALYSARTFCSVIWPHSARNSRFGVREKQLLPSLSLSQTGCVTWEAFQTEWVPVF
jgi:hypothetical protein